MWVRLDTPFILVEQAAKFSKLLSLVTLNSKYGKTRTFENFRLLRISWYVLPCAIIY